MLPDLSAIHVFQMVAHTRNFRQAARLLDMSPSALSYQINRLEQQLGVRLLQRTTRSVTLTSEGEFLLERASPALKNLQDMVDELQSKAEMPAGVLRINCSEGAAQLVFRRYVPELLKRYPKISLEIITESRLIDIVDAGFDFGMRTRDLIPLDMVALPCDSPVNFILVAAPSYLSQAGTPSSPADLANHLCIRTRLPNGGPHYSWEFKRGNDQYKFDPKGPLSLDCQSLQIEAAIEGCGIVWINRSAITKHLEDGVLQAILSEWCPPSEELCFYYSKTKRKSAAMTTFINLIQELRATTHYRSV